MTISSILNNNWYLQLNQLGNSNQTQGASKSTDATTTSSTEDPLRHWLLSCRI